jgi:hypothetical protein
MVFILTYVATVLLVIEIAVVLMRSTGLKYDIARFQVISLLTSTGFTTKESELILAHPVRRRLGMFLILFGVFSLAIMISSISSILAPEFSLSSLVIVPVVLLVVLAVLKLPGTLPLLTTRFTLLLEQKFEVSELPIQDVLLHSDEDAFVEVPIGPNSPRVGLTLGEICGEEEPSDINALFIQRGTETIRKERLGTKLELGDILYIYGDKTNVDRIFRPELQDKKERLLNEKKALAWIEREG